jgi:type IV secretory pathway TrbD component
MDKCLVIIKGACRFSAIAGITLIELLAFGHSAWKHIFALIFLWFVSFYQEKEMNRHEP